MKTSAKYIADRIRLMIATKQFQVGEVLPSTRELGQQLEASFHTVRKAYHVLADEGLITSEPGRGFVVNRQSPMLDKAQRLEIGGEKIQSLVEELVGYGLDDAEIEILFQEQLDFMEWPDRIQSCASVGENNEMASMLSSAIKKQIGVKSKTLSLDEYDNAAKYDALFVPIKFVHQFRSLSESIMIIPIVYMYDPEILYQISEQAGIQTIGLVTADEESIPKIINELKQSIPFEGSFVAGSIYGRSLPLFVRDTDLILYTQGSARLVEQKVPIKNRIRLDYRLADRSAEMIRAELWDQ
ncbi:GntR family transcriptional regulator [Balneola vulgaris]|uniref:GntR family transcriptional regulator n=1 Tax=Balneola vulgaris TaxID=287535 RepID=UPI000363938B|nr:GntR family transcriptional regulator [Balneola vulgaris]